MKTKMLALCAALCLLLSACGGGEKAQPSKAEPESAKTESVESAAESSREEAAEAPQDPEELGKWLWERNESQDERHFALDVDMDMNIKVMIAEETTTQKLKSRLRQIRREDGTMAYQVEEQYLDTRMELWYDNGTVYLSDDYGSYKAPMDLDLFQEQYASDGSSDLLELDGSNFGTLTGEKTETGYVLTYGDVDIKAWMALSGMMNGMLDMVDGNCEDFTLSGTITMDARGDLIRHEMNMNVTLALMGITMTEELKMIQSVNSVDENVSIVVPEDDEDFREIGDIAIPKTFCDGFNSTLAQDSLGYQSTWTLELSDSQQGMKTTYGQEDDISYVFDDTGLQVLWTTTALVDGEVVGWTEDSYAGGEGVLTDPDGEEPYVYDDESFGQDIAAFLTAYVDSFDTGSGYALTQNGDLTYDLDAEYVENLLDSYLTDMETGVDIGEALEKFVQGTMTVRFGADGSMVSQELAVSAELTYEAGVISVTFRDLGSVISVSGLGMA